MRAGILLLAIGLLAACGRQPNKDEQLMARHRTPTPTPTPAISAITYNNVAFLNGANLTAGTSYTVTVQATVATSSITFTRDSIFIKTATARPFSVTLTPGTTGTHTLFMTPKSATGKTGATIQRSYNVKAKPTPSPTPISTPSQTPTPQTSPTPTPTPSSTATPTPTPTTTPAPTPTPSPSPTPTPTPTPEQSVSATFIQPQTNGTDSYNLYFGIAPGDYGAPIDGGTQGTWTLTLQPNTTYYLASTAQNGQGESGKSPEIKFP